MKRRHDVAPDDKRGIGSFNMAEPAKSIHGLFTGISLFIWFVGLGGILVGTTAWEVALLASIAGLLSNIVFPDWGRWSGADDVAFDRFAEFALLLAAR